MLFAQEKVKQCWGITGCVYANINEELTIVNSLLIRFLLVLRAKREWKRIRHEESCVMGQMFIKL